MAARGPGPWCPSESSVPLLVGRPRRPPSSRGVTCPSESPAPSYRPTGSAIPLCRWPLPRLCGLPRAPTAGTRQSIRHTPLVGFGPPSESCPAEPSRPPQRPAPLPGFGPHSTCKARRSAHPRALPARHVPPSGFGYPPDGFLPPGPGRTSFSPAALTGFALRSFPLPQGAATLPPRRTRMPFSAPLRAGRTPDAGPERLGFRAFAPAGVPGAARDVSPAAALAAPLGFALSGRSRRPWLRLPGASSPAPAHRRHRVSIDRRLAAGRTGGSPHRVPVPVRSRTLDRRALQAYGFTPCPAVHRCPLPGTRRRVAAACRSCPDRPWYRALGDLTPPHLQDTTCAHCGQPFLRN